MLLGLAMTPAERLRWLETTVAEMRRILGKARRAPGSAIRKHPADEPPV